MRRHQAGHLAEAEPLYRQILRYAPRHHNALHLLGLIAHQVHRDDAAIALIGEAIRINPGAAAYHSNLGLALNRLGRADEAVAAYRAALCLTPDYAEAQCNLGVALKDAARLAEAVAAYGVALRVRPDYAQAHYNLGNALVDQERRVDAVAAYGAALCLRPDYAEAYYNRGNAFADLDRVQEAVAAYGAALGVRPDYAEVRANLGNALSTLGSPKAALASLRTALCLKPDYAEAYSNLANALKSGRRHAEALAACVAALRILPELAEAAYNLGATHFDLGNLSEAVSAYHAALSVKPEFAEAQYNLAIARCDLGRLDSAIAAYRAALRIKPDFAEARYGAAIALLLDGRWEEGWSGYEERWQTKGFPSPRRRVPQPLWRGENLDGKAILLDAEQGIGDAIQFCRYAPLVAARGGRVILETHRSLLRLLRGLPGVDRLVAIGDPLPEFDVHCPVMSLPGLFGTRPDRVPPALPFAADRARAARWQRRLGSADCKIGIVWQGNPDHSRDRDRSVPLAQFATLASVAGARFIALQRKHGLDQIRSCPGSLRLSLLGPDYDDGDFLETASVLAALDLVISIDSAVAHLAGTMGVPVWVALPFAPDWRWLRERDDTPWYPSMRLFRQSARGDWQAPFDRMAQRLGAMIEGRKTGRGTAPG